MGDDAAVNQTNVPLAWLSSKYECIKPLGWDGVGQAYWGEGGNVCLGPAALEVAYPPSAGSLLTWFLHPDTTRSSHFCIADTITKP